MSIPQIIIIEQLTPGHERFANDKVQKDVGVCVKKKSFPIKVSTANQNYDLSKLNFVASLHYDNSSKDTVDYIEQLPLTYKSKLSKDKMSVTLEVNILVLSSQMENSLFLIKIRAESKKDSNKFSECFSMPIKVVSKVTQLQTKAKKRTRNRSTPTKDMFITAMEKLDEGQEKHSQLLATLLQQSNQQTQVLMMLLQDESNEIATTIKQDDTILDDICTPENVPNKRIKVEEEDKGKSSPANNQLDFAFKDLFDSFSTLDDNFYGLIQYPSIVEANNNNDNNNNNNNLTSTDPFSFHFEEEVISDSPNHISSHDHSEELIFEDEFPTRDQTKGTYNSIDFGSFPNLFDINNL